MKASELSKILTQAPRVFERERDTGNGGLVQHPPKGIISIPPFT